MVIYLRKAIANPTIADVSEPSVHASLSAPVTFRRNLQVPCCRMDEEWVMEAEYICGVFSRSA